ncbi:uncharacterized protein LOC124161154 [Ischnura elegans]|uniref:uncharacterized protein LOC124161154 n=1 Tax=Ischnura elegans TaxID=197161 RepID=UPI001ED88C03|nr:uncharacterized protein LOC124161154 [Ischnura elegans]
MVLLNTKVFLLVGIAVIGINFGIERGLTDAALVKDPVIKPAQIDAIRLMKADLIGDARLGLDNDDDANDTGALDADDDKNAEGDDVADDDGEDEDLGAPDANPTADSYVVRGTQVLKIHGSEKEFAL